MAAHLPIKCVAKLPRGLTPQRSERVVHGALVNENGLEPAHFPCIFSMVFGGGPFEDLLQGAKCMGKGREMGGLKSVLVNKRTMDQALLTLWS